MADPYINTPGNVLTSELSQVENDLKVYTNVRDSLDSNDIQNIELLNNTISNLEAKRSQIKTAISKKEESCVINNQDIGWMRENIDSCKTFISSEQYAYWKDVVSTEMTGVDPCGTTTLASINKSLKKLFTFLKAIKKYYNTYVQSVLNTISSVTETISNVSRLIVGVLRILIQRVRNWVIQKIKNLLNDAFTSLFPNLAKKIKDAVVKLIIDSIFCKFGEIIRGLGQLVNDFLYSLIGNMINAPFCAAEQFTNALINNLANRIDKALKPLLDQINGIIGGIGQVAGSVFEAIDFILGFESFLCSSGPECPELKTFRTSWWGGPPQEAADEFENFLGGLNLSSGETDDLLNQFDRWVGNFEIFKGSGNEIDSSTSTFISQLNCDTGAFACGPPQVQIFGGGGIGAVGKAIVNKSGEIVGVDLINRGQGYISPPYISFVDNCGNGNYASGYAVIDDTNEEIPIDSITFDKIGDSTKPDLENNPQGYVGRNLDGKCEYGARVYHEFDNNLNITTSSELSSNIDVAFEGREAPDRLITDLSSDEKHYSIKFIVPYDSDDYEIKFTKVAQIAAHGGGGGEFKVAGIKNKTKNGFDVWFGRTAYVLRSQNTQQTEERTVTSTVSREVTVNSNVSARFERNGTDLYLVTSGDGNAKISFNVVIDDNPKTNGVAANEIIIFSDNGSLTFNRTKEKQRINKSGQFTAGRKYKINVIGGANRTPNVSNSKIGLLDFDGLDENIQLTIDSISNNTRTETVSSTTSATVDVAPERPDRFEPKIALNYAPEGQLYNTYVRFFEFTTIGERKNCTPGNQLKEIIITNPGNGYLPSPDGKNEFGESIGDLPAEDELQFSDDTREYVGCLSDIQIISTGIGYTENDTITIEPNIPDLEVRVRLTDLGQIVQMEILNTSCGLDTIPEITINSSTGGGAIFRPVIQFTPKNSFRGVVKESEIVRVIDCVIK